MDTKKTVLILLAVIAAIGIAVGIMYAPHLTNSPETEPEDSLDPADPTDPVDPGDVLSGIEIDSMHFTINVLREVQRDPEAPSELVESTEEVMVRGISDRTIDYRVKTSMEGNEQIEMYNYAEGTVYIFPNPQTFEEEWTYLETRVEEDPNFLQTVANHAERAETYGVGKHDITDELEGVESATVEFHEIDGEIPTENFLPPEDADPQLLEPPEEQGPSEEEMPTP
ncbi:MAG: hypothetical protein ACOC6H_03760 [Thermoproteota archaeon]